MMIERIPNALCIAIFLSDSKCFLLDFSVVFGLKKRFSSKENEEWNKKIEKFSGN